MLALILKIFPFLSFKDSSLKLNFVLQNPYSSIMATEFAISSMVIAVIIILSVIMTPQPAAGKPSSSLNPASIGDQVNTVCSKTSKITQKFLRQINKVDLKVVNS